MNLFGYRSFRRSHFGKKKPSRPKYTSKLVKLAARPKKTPNANRAYHYARLTGRAALPYMKYNSGGHRVPTPTRFVKKYYSAKKAPSGKAKMNYTYKSMGDGTYIRIDNKTGRASTAFGKKKKPSKKTSSKAGKVGTLGKSFKVIFTASGVIFYDSTGKKVSKKLKKMSKSSYSLTIRRKRGGSVYMIRGPIKKGKAGKATFHHKLR